MNDRLNNIKPQPERFDAEFQNLADGLSNCIARDGQSVITANIPMNGKRITNLGAPVLGTDALSADAADARFATTIAGKAALASTNTFTAQQIISGSYPTLALLWGGVIRMFFRVDSNGSVIFQNGDNSAVYHRFYTNGHIETSQYGLLSTYVANVADSYAVSRATEYSNDRLNTATARINNKSARLAFLGDLGNDWNLDGGMVDLYNGGCISTRATTLQGGTWQPYAFRWRQLQMSDSNGNWYACGSV